MDVSSSGKTANLFASDAKDTRFDSEGLDDVLSIKHAKLLRGAPSLRESGVNHDGLASKGAHSLWRNGSVAALEAGGGSSILPGLTVVLVNRDHISL